MSIRIGINPLTWTNDDLPSLGDATPLGTCLKEAAAAGYAGVELGRKFPREPDVLGPLLDEHGLSLVSGWYSLKLLERDAEEEFVAMQAHLELLAALGSDVMVCAEVSRCVHGNIDARLSSRPQLTGEQFGRFARRLDELAKRMQETGMRLAYHHHMGTVIETAVEVGDLMESTSTAVSLLLDTGHLAFAGGDPLAVAKAHAKRIAHVHCKDIRADVLQRVRNADTSFLEAVLQGVFTVPGDGAVDYAPVFEVLSKSGYSGWLVVEAEQDPAIADPMTCATLGYSNLERMSQVAWPR